MITAISPSRPDCFLVSVVTPEDREIAVSTVIQGWDLQAITKLWEDQIKPDLKDGEQLQNVTEVFNGRFKDITNICDDWIKDLSKKLADRVDALFQNFIKISAHFDQYGNIHEVEAEGGELICLVQDIRLYGGPIILVAEARFKTIQKEWDLRMKHLDENPLKQEAEQDHYEAMNQAYRVYAESFGQVNEAQYRARSLLADFCVMESENTAWKSPLARQHQLDFISRKLLATASSNTGKAFLHKNKEATPFFIFLMVYSHVFGDLRQEVLPYFFTQELRKEIQRLRSENLSEDMAISSIEREKFFVDFDEFNALSCSLRNIPSIEKLLKISERILENEDFMSAFFDCWDTCVDAPSDSCEAFQTVRQRIEQSKTSLSFPEETCDLLFNLSLK